MSGKQQVLFTAFIAVGFAVLGWSIFMPKGRATRPWNSTAVMATYEGAEMKEVDAANARIFLIYELANTAGSDCRLASSGSVIMTRGRNDGGLAAQPNAHLSADAVVPAGQRARVQIEIDAPFAWPAVSDPAVVQDQLKRFVNQTLSGVQEFDLFDQADRFQIQFPKGWQDLIVSAATAP